MSKTFEKIFNSKRPESKFRKILLNVDLQLPYVIIPEFGSIQKYVLLFLRMILIIISICLFTNYYYGYFNRGENILVVDFGGLKIKSDLQPETICLDDVTQMEMEEKLYDRYHIDIDGFQLIFCNSGKYF